MYKNTNPKPNRNSWVYTHFQTLKYEKAMRDNT